MFPRFRFDPIRAENQLSLVKWVRSVSMNKEEEEKKNKNGESRQEEERRK